MGIRKPEAESRKPLWDFSEFRLFLWDVWDNGEGGETMADNHKQAHAAPRCQYIRMNDQRCTQPALKDQLFCRFHDLLEGPALPAAVIPFVEDATSLQVAIMQVIRTLQRGQIDRRTAGTILYALQLASSNLKRFCEENGHPYESPVRKTPQERKEEELAQQPSLAEMLIERLNLVPRQEPAVPPSPFVSAAANDCELPDHQISRSPEGGVIDKMEACDVSEPASAPPTPVLLGWDRATTSLHVVQQRHGKMGKHIAAGEGA